jgi:hypothetical protein
MRRSIDLMLFVSWLGLGAAIELLGYHLALYKFVHPALPFIVAIGLFGIVAPILQTFLRDRPLAFAALIFGCAVAIEFSNAAWLHWWTFNDKIRESFTNSGMLAMGASAPLLPIAWIMGVGFRTATDEDGILPGIIRSGVPRPYRRAAIFSLICTLLLIALGRYGNAEYLLRPLGFGYLASIAPIEARAISPPINTDNALVVFAVQTALMLIALALSVRLCGLSAASLGFRPNRAQLQQGLPLLLFLCAAPLPLFVLAGLDPTMSSNYPFVPQFASVPGFLFLGFASVMPQDTSEAISQTTLGILAGTLSCVAYIVWHLGKPVPELFGAVLWGPIACAIVWRTRNIYFLVLPHWLWNVVLDVFVTLRRLAVFGP